MKLLVLFVTGLALIQLASTQSRTAWSASNSAAGLDGVPVSPRADSGNKPGKKETVNALKIDTNVLRLVREGVLAPLSNLTFHVSRYVHSTNGDRTGFQYPSKDLLGSEHVNKHNVTTHSNFRSLPSENVQFGHLSLSEVNVNHLDKNLDLNVDHLPYPNRQALTKSLIPSGIKDTTIDAAGINKATGLNIKALSDYVASNSLQSDILAQTILDVKSLLNRRNENTPGTVNETILTADIANEKKGSTGSELSYDHLSVQITNISPHEYGLSQATDTANVSQKELLTDAGPANVSPTKLPTAFATDYSTLFGNLYDHMSTGNNQGPITSKLLNTIETVQENHLEETKAPIPVERIIKQQTNTLPVTNLDDKAYANNLLSLTENAHKMQTYDSTFKIPGSVPHSEKLVIEGIGKQDNLKSDIATVNQTRQHSMYSTTEIDRNGMHALGMGSDDQTPGEFSNGYMTTPFPDIHAEPSGHYPREVASQMVDFQNSTQSIEGYDPKMTILEQLQKRYHEQQQRRRELLAYLDQRFDFSSLLSYSNSTETPTSNTHNVNLAERTTTRTLTAHQIDPYMNPTKPIESAAHIEGTVTMNHDTVLHPFEDPFAAKATAINGDAYQPSLQEEMAGSETVYSDPIPVISSVDFTPSRSSHSMTDVQDEQRNAFNTGRNQTNTSYSGSDGIAQETFPSKSTNDKIIIKPFSDTFYLPYDAISDVASTTTTEKPTGMYNEFDISRAGYMQAETQTYGKSQLAFSDKANISPEIDPNSQQKLLSMQQEMAQDRLVLQQTLSALLDTMNNIQTFITDSKTKETNTQNVPIIDTPLGTPGPQKTFTTTTSAPPTTTTTTTPAPPPPTTTTTTSMPTTTTTQTQPPVTTQTVYDAPQYAQPQIHEQSQQLNSQQHWTARPDGNTFWSTTPSLTYQSNDTTSITATDGTASNTAEDAGALQLDSWSTALDFVRNYVEAVSQSKPSTPAPVATGQTLSSDQKLNQLQSLLEGISPKQLQSLVDVIKNRAGGGGPASSQDAAPRPEPRQSRPAQEPRGLPRDLPRDYPRDMQPPRDFPRDMQQPPRDFSRDMPPRDFSRDGPRDMHRDRSPFGGRNSGPSNGRPDYIPPPPGSENRGAPPREFMRGGPHPPMRGGPGGPGGPGDMPPWARNGPPRGGPPEGMGGPPRQRGGLDMNNPQVARLIRVLAGRTGGARNPVTGEQPEQSEGGAMNPMMMAMLMNGGGGGGGLAQLLGGGGGGGGNPLAELLGGGGGGGGLAALMGGGGGGSQDLASLLGGGGGGMAGLARLLSSGSGSSGESGSGGGGLASLFAGAGGGGGSGSGEGGSGGMNPAMLAALMGAGGGAGGLLGGGGGGESGGGMRPFSMLGGFGSV